MDMTIGTAIWFAARGKGITVRTSQNPHITSKNTYSIHPKTHISQPGIVQNDTSETSEGAEGNKLYESGINRTDTDRVVTADGDTVTATYVEGQLYNSGVKVLLNGLGADEQLAGTHVHSTYT